MTSFVDNIESIGNYTITSKPKKLSDNLYFYEECEDINGDLFDILIIRNTEANERMLKRIIDNEVKPLVNKDILGFVKTIETGFDKQYKFYYIVYEHFGIENYDINKCNIDIPYIINIAEGLNWFRTSDNSQKFIISPKYIRVDEKGNARLLFAKLFDIFATDNILEEIYLSPETKKYLSDRSQPSPRLQDDIYSLVKTFKGFINNNYSTCYKEITGLIMENCLAENRIARFSKYSDLIDLLKQLPSIKKKDYRIIKITTQPEHYCDFQTIISSMNKNTWMIVDHERSKANQVTGQFTTDDYSGRYFVNNQGHIFIPFNERIHEKNEKIISKEDSFLAEFLFTMQDNYNYNCTNFFEEKHQAINNLAILTQQNKDKLSDWQKLPEIEKDYIEKNAFNVKYSKRELSKDGQKITFKLTDDVKISWSKIKTLKNEQKKLFVDETLLGEIFEWKSADKTISISNPKCSIEELPKQGELSEDIRQETSQFKKQIESCQRFLKREVVNQELCDIVATPEEEIDCRVHNLNYNDFETQLYNKKLDPSQLESALESISYKPMYLIQGPPGAGKTTVIVEIIRQLVKKQKDIKILLTSQSNLAVDNVLEKLIDIDDVQFIRLASLNALGNDTVSEKMKSHCYEEKLKRWITETEKLSNKYFEENYLGQENTKGIEELFKKLEATRESNNFSEFTKYLNYSPGYIKRLFEKANDFKTAEKIFEKQFGEDYLKLKQIQKDWISFISNSLVDADSDGKRKKSMLNNGCQEIDFLTAMLMKTNVVGSTCIHIASSKYSKINFKFDYVIMDESSKATPAESLVPLSMGRNIIMIGDDKQLPPVITREDDVKDQLEDEGLDINKTFGESLFEKIKKAFEQSDYNRRYVKMLDIQYRMPKQIGNLISEFFYDGKLKNPNIEGYDKSKEHGLKLKKQTSIVFLSTSNIENHQDNSNKEKRQNQCNVNAIKELLGKLNISYSNNPQKESPFSIGVIAGYRGQVELLKQQINTSEYNNFISNDKRQLIEINTVDQFQGAERDIIIYDIVRSSLGRDNIGFLADYRRINVAFSRAKRMLFIVGDSEYILKRAGFNPTDDFPEFKLRLITEKLKKEGFIFYNLNDVFDE